jgi:hypothetical protein
MFKFVAICFVALVAASARAGPITYDLGAFQVSGTYGWGDAYLGFIDQQPANLLLTGSVTTDGVLGALAETDIISWNFTVADLPTGGAVFAVSSSEYQTFASMRGNLLATPSTLSLPALGDSLSLTARFFVGGTSDVFLSQEIAITAANYGLEITLGSKFEESGAETIADSTTAFPIGAPLVIATVAPEPSTLILAALGGLALLAWRRRR